MVYEETAIGKVAPQMRRGGAAEGRHADISLPFTADTWLAVKLRSTAESWKTVSSSHGL